MGNVEKAVFLSLVVHAAVALALAVYVGSDSVSSTRPELEVSAVELSIANEDDLSEATALQSEPTPAQTSRQTPSEEASPAVDGGIRETLPVPPELVPPLAGEPIVEMHLEKISSTAASSAASPSRPAANRARIEAPARPVSAIKPVYPPQSRRRGEQGIVKLALEVDAFGVVSKASVAVSSGFKALDEAALRAVKAAVFSPARSGEGNVGSSVGLTLVFKLK